MVRRLAFVASLAVLGSLLLSSTASAAFHLNKIRQVYLGSSAGANDAYIELQMYAAGENLVAGHPINTYTAAGTLLGNFTIPNNAPNGQNQRTILIGDTAVSGRDVTYDMLTETVSTYGPGGAACYPDATPPECVAWGNFSGSALVPGAVGSPAAPGGIPTGSAITRSISPGCPTLLEASDDTDNSAVDFSITGPSPRGNSVAPTESPCVPGSSIAARCAGKAATITGSNASETLKGTAAADVIAGLGGKDVITGLAGNDLICGGAGKDRLSGGKGKDRLLGGKGRDTLKGGPGKDKLKGGPGKDVQVQ